MAVKFSKKFSKQYQKSDAKVKKAFDQRLKLFVADPFSHLLDNHGLTGNYAGFRSVNITGDWRAIFYEQADGRGASVVTFVAIGTHSQLYGW